jgi:hypothetical protein
VNRSPQTRILVPGDEKVIWACSACGAISRAKRRPTTHERRERDPAVEDGWRYVLCGPFRRYIATEDDPRPTRASLRIGTVVRVVGPGYEEGYVPDPNLGF